LAEYLGFSVWMIWSIVATKLPEAGFNYTTDQLFQLVALPGLVGLLLLFPYTFAVPRVGGRNWTIVSAALLFIPAFALAYFVGPLISASMPVPRFRPTISFLPRGAWSWASVLLGALHNNCAARAAFWQTAARIFLSWQDCRDGAATARTGIAARGAWHGICSYVLRIGSLRSIPGPTKGLGFQQCR
jgi:hypothetical protein